MSGEPLKVLIADDHPLMLAGLRRALERSDGIEIVGEARSGTEVLALVERRRPGLVVLDLRMPGISGTECIEQIKERWPDVKVVVLSAYDDPNEIDAALQAGASAYIVKSVEPVDIAALLRQTAAGSVYHANRRAGARPRDCGNEPASLVLTDREQAILAAVAAGATTAAISRDLWVSQHTVKFHLTNIYRKLGVSNRAAAVRYAFDNGIANAA